MSIQELEDLMEELRENAHEMPIISNVWLNYLTIKKQKLENAINECKVALNAIHSNSIHQDIPSETLIFLSMLSKTIRDQ